MINRSLLPQVFYEPDGGGGGASGNPLELLITLGIDGKSAGKNLQAEINNIKGIQKQIDLGLSDKSVANITSELSKLGVKPFDVVAKLDVQKTKENISKQIQRMKFGEVEISTKVKSAANNTTPKKTTETINQKVKVDTLDYKNIDEVMKKYNNKEFKVKVKYDELTKAVKQIDVAGKKAENLNQSFTIKPSVDTNGIKGFNKIISSVDNSNFNNLTDNLKKAQKELENLSKSGKVSANSLNGLKATSSELSTKLSNGTLNNTDIKNFSNSVKELKNDLTNVPTFLNKISTSQERLNELQHKGLITQKTYSQYSERLNQIKFDGSAKSLNQFNNELLHLTNNSKRAMELEKSVSLITNREQDMLSVLVKLERQYPKTFDKQGAEKLRQEIEQLISSQKKLNTATGEKSLKFANMGEVNKVSQGLDSINSKIKLFSAEATTAGRNSMSLWESFKTAMEKFPIWLGASTIFFGLAKGAKELTQTIIEVDTKMTNLKKVMSSDTNFDDIFTSATENAKTFGQTLTDTLSAYEEFAKQGFKGEELESLTQAGLVTANVGELTSQDASQFITSTLIQWKKDTSDAMG